MSPYTDHRARALATNARIALVGGGLVALFLATAAAGSGFKMTPVHWCFAAGVAGILTASTLCMLLAHRIEVTRLSGVRRPVSAHERG
jgi:hypothetical protein